MAWNLIDTLNSDLKTENLFDGLPENAKKLSGQALPPEKVQEIAAPPRLDDSPESIRWARLKQDVGQAQVFNSAKPVSEIGVFDSIPAVEKTQFTEAQPVREEARKATLGEVFNQGVGHVRDIEASFKANNYGKDGEKGENTAVHAAWKAAYLEKLSSHVEDNYGIPRDQVGTIFATLAKTNGGFRTAREMDEIIKIQKEGVSFTGVDGEVTVGPDEPWEVALGAYKAKQTAALRGKEPVDLVKRTGEIQGVLKNATDANGEPLPGQEAVFDNALKALAQLNGIPTETSQYGYGVGRLSKQMSEFQNAQAVEAASYGGVTSDQFGARISELQIQIQEKAIKDAPTFNTIDERAKWLSNRETAGLPFFMGIGGKKALVRATGEPNIVEEFVSQGKSGSPEMIKHDLAASPKIEPEKPKSEFTGAGESGQRVRRGIGKVGNASSAALDMVANAISDIPSQAANAASGVAEFGAGVAGYNIDVPEVNTPARLKNPFRDDRWFGHGVPTVEQIRKDQEMIAKRKKK
jgi:hypothetical protein